MFEKYGVHRLPSWRQPVARPAAKGKSTTTSSGSRRSKTRGSIASSPAIREELPLSEARRRPADLRHPAIGTRMPPQAPADRRGGHRRSSATGSSAERRADDGRLAGPEVTTPGSPATGIREAELATRQTGTGTITGTVVDQQRRPLAGALVTLLLRGERLRAGRSTTASPRRTPRGGSRSIDAPAGRFLLKAYGPRATTSPGSWPSRMARSRTVESGCRTASSQPADRRRSVQGLQLSLDVRGSNLDGNYTLAVNPGAGRRRAAQHQTTHPGAGRPRSPRRCPAWIFMAVDEQCNVSEFLTVGG